MHACACDKLLADEEKTGKGAFPEGRPTYQRWNEVSQTIGSRRLKHVDRVAMCTAISINMAQRPEKGHLHEKVFISGVLHHLLVVSKYR